MKDSWIHCELYNKNKIILLFQRHIEQLICASFIDSLDRRFDFIDHSQFLNIFMNVANEQSRRQLNEIENPHQFIAAARHVTDCNCEIDNHFMNFLPFKL